MIEETIVVGRIGFDGKSGRFCPGIPISLSLGRHVGRPRMPTSLFSHIT